MTELLQPLMPFLHSIFGQDVDWKQEIGRAHV